MNKKFLLIPVFLGFISLLTPMVFHVSATRIYQFWFWGLVLFFGYTSSEVGVVNNAELEFIIPATILMIIIILSSGLILKSSIDELRKNEFNDKYSIIGGSVMIAAPLLLMVLWQLIYTLGGIHPTFWGTYEGLDYYMPSFSFLLQLIAGGIAVVSSLKVKKNKK